MSLSDREKLVLQSAVEGGTGLYERLRKRLRNTQLQTKDLLQISEAFLQMHLFVGYPPMIESLRILYEETENTVKPETGKDGPDQFLDDGTELARKLYGETYEEMIETMGRYHPVLPNWILRDGYGRVLSRSSLPLRSRSLVTISLLAASGHERQLHSHLRGALRVGADSIELKEVNTLLENVLPEPLDSAVQTEFDSVIHQKE